MKTLSVILVSVFCSFAVCAADDAAPEVKLTGIAQLGARTVALVEIKPARGPVFKPLLAPGERVMDVELTAIDAKAGKVSLNVKGTTTEVSLGASDATGQPAALHLRDAASPQALEVYQQLSGRTVLFSPSLPAAGITLKTGAGKEAALEALAQALRDQGIVVTPRGDKFAFATTFSHVPRLAQIPEPPAPAKESKDSKEAKDEVFPPGLIKFIEADRTAVLDIYQELTGRTLLVSPDLPPAKFTVRSQTAQTRAEAVWMLDAMMYLATIKMVPEWTKFTFALPATRGVTAPKIPDNPAADKLKDSKKSFPPGLLKFSGAPPQTVLEVYAELIGREALPLSSARIPVPAARFTLKSQTELHYVEAIYALDALAELNHLRFVLVGDRQVKIVHVSEASPTGAGKN